MPPKSSHYRMADRLAGGNLEQILADYRDAGLSSDAVARRLYAAHGIEVTGNTVATWTPPVADSAVEEEAS